MEILNKLPERKYLEIDDFLAFLGVYEDEGRLSAFKKALSKYKRGVVVEAGAGLGELSEVILKTVRPRKLYLVEENSIAFEILRDKFKDYDNVKVVKSLVEEWEPLEEIDLLVQEFYGPLLYDESLESLNRLKFQPREIFPNRGFLKYQVVSLKDLDEPVITPKIWEKFKGILVSDIFWYFDDYKPHGTVLEWHDRKLKRFDVSIEEEKGDVLVLAVEVWHEDEKLCDPVLCPNWPFVFTPVAGRSFDIDFEYHAGIAEVIFNWKR